MPWLELIKKMDLKDEQVKADLVARYDADRKHLSTLEKIYACAYTNKPGIKETFLKTSEEKIKEDRAKKQQALLEEFLVKGDILSLKLLLSGPHFSLDLNQAIKLNSARGMIRYTQLRDPMPPLFHALSFGNFELLSFLLNYFKTQYGVALRSDYLHWQDSSGKKTCIYTEAKAMLAHLQSANRPKLGETLDKEALNFLVHYYLTLIPQSYLMANPPDRLSDELFYNYCVAKAPELLETILDNGWCTREKLVESELLHDAIAQNRREVFKKLLPKLAAEDCLIPRASGIEWSPLRIAAFNVGERGTFYLDALLKKLGRQALQAIAPEEKKLIAWLCILGSGFDTYPEAKIVSYLKLMHIWQAPQIIDTDILHSFNLHAFRDSTASHQYKAGLIVSKLYREGIDLHAIVNAFIEKEIRRLVGRVDLTIFGPRKHSKLLMLQELVRSPQNFYNFFVLSANFDNYQEDMSTEELLQFASERIIQARPRQDQHRAMRDCLAKTSFANTAYDPYQSMSDIFKSTRILPPLKKTNSEDQWTKFIAAQVRVEEPNAALSVN